jgi:hypothetical protein
LLEAREAGGNLALVDECGWTEAAYESWLSETLIAALLPRGITG